MPRSVSMGAVAIPSWSVHLLTFRSTTLQQEIYLLVVTLRSAGCLAGHWAGVEIRLTVSCAGQEVQAPARSPLHKPHRQHCCELRERIWGIFFLFWSFKSICESGKFGCTVKILDCGWLLALERFFSLRFLVLALYSDSGLTLLPEWLSSQDELYVCLNACGFGV